MNARRIAIQVEGVSKTFRVPSETVTTARETLLEPFRRTRYEVRDALKDVTFEVRRGSMTALLGRNGSGKSTLLKLIAGIYATDVGTIRIAGRLAPFIELGVGFDRDLPAYDNVVMNAVMMGLQPKQARERFERIMDFAELDGVAGMKLRNYSSGMQVRLAFAVMAQVDADVLLVDEVLAVGDVAFQRKCFDEFRRLNQLGTTIVLVTHSLEAVREHCDEAVLLHDGQVQSTGRSDAVADRYLELTVGEKAGTR